MAEAEVERRPCAVHGDRSAVARCAECGRAACLTCAIPFRGRVLCSSCAARALGEPTPPLTVSPPSRGPDLMATVILVGALLLTLVPWHGFPGALTQPVSAWRAEPDPWPTVACGLLLGAAVVLAASLLRGRPPGRLTALAYSTFAGLATAATVRAFLGTPDHFEHTPAPFAIMALGAGAAAVGAVRLVRART
jgi:hypothetical protein